MLQFISDEFLQKFLKYAVVGFLGTFIDFGCTWLAKEKLKIGKYIANSIGFSAAVTSNYLINRFWTFNSTDPQMMIQFGKFIVVSLFGLLLNNFIIYLLNEKRNVNFYISKLFAIGVVILWNFFANYFYTFKTV